MPDTAPTNDGGVRLTSIRRWGVLVLLLLLGLGTWEYIAKQPSKEPLVSETRQAAPEPSVRAITIKECGGMNEPGGIDLHIMTYLKAARFDDIPPNCESRLIMMPTGITFLWVGPSDSPDISFRVHQYWLKQGVRLEGNQWPSRSDLEELPISIQGTGDDKLIRRPPPIAIMLQNIYPNQTITLEAIFDPHLVPRPKPPVPGADQN